MPDLERQINERVRYEAAIQSENGVDAIGD